MQPKWLESLREIEVDEPWTDPSGETYLIDVVDLVEPREHDE
jgi:hypothetical protein